ncbi:MAG: fibronectin type III domain-containing protein, partial [bacterium]
LTGATEGLVTLTWTAPGDTGMLGNAASYQLRYATAPFNEAGWGGPGVTALTGLTPPQAQGNGDMRSFFFSTIAIYYFGLKALDDEGFASAIDSRTTNGNQAWAVPYATPTAPLFLSAAGVSTGSVRVTWQDRSNLEDRYAVYFTSVPADLNASGDLSLNVTFWDMTGLKANAVGIPSSGATVRAFKGAASSLSGSFGAIYSLPHAPADLFSSSQSGGSITLAWRDPAGGAPGPGGDWNASRYGVEIANSALGPWTLVRSWTDLVTSTGTIVTGLVGGSNYYLRVLGYNANGTEGGRSGVLSVWTRPAEVTTAAPGGVGATSTSDRRVKITWTANLEPDLAGYTLSRREGTGDWLRIPAAVLGAAATCYEDAFPLTTAVFPVYVYAVASRNTQGGESAGSPSPGVTVRIERQYADVAGRGALAVYDLVTGAYTDPIGRSSPLRVGTNTDDGVFGFFVDLNGDGQADAYWAP